MTLAHGGAALLAAVVSLTVIPSQGLQGVLLTLYVSAGADVLAMVALTLRMCRRASAK